MRLKDNPSENIPGGEKKYDVWQFNSDFIKGFVPIRYSMSLRIRSIF